MKLHRPGAPRQPLVQMLLATMFCLVGGWAVYGGGGEQLFAVRSHPAYPYRPPYTFPAGGRILFPRYRLIALYGTPGEPVLGALGQQPLPASLARVKALAHTYQPFMSEHALPTLEIITTVASASPGNGSYSYPINQGTLASWILAAKQQGVYIVLDLQPGRESFLAQTQRYQALLRQPNVGLALDPEWRLTPSEVPLEQIGTVSIAEVNSTASWLAALTSHNKLPQKLFLLHEFRTSMISDRQRLDTTHPELAYAIQMDGQGTQSQKLDTWHVITVTPPANIHFGWKNFYAKDSPIRSPAETMQLSPKPWYVSYQ